MANLSHTTTLSELIDALHAEIALRNNLNSLHMSDGSAPQRFSAPATAKLAESAHERNGERRRGKRREDRHRGREHARGLQKPRENCFYCENPGHFARECRKRPHDESQGRYQGPGRSSRFSNASCRDGGSHHRSRLESDSRGKPVGWDHFASSVASFNDHFETVNMTNDNYYSFRFRGCIDGHRSNLACLSAAKRYEAFLDSGVTHHFFWDRKYCSATTWVCRGTFFVLFCERLGPNKGLTGFFTASRRQVHVYSLRPDSAAPGRA